MLASDVNNPQFAGAIDPDAVMVARFYVKAVKNNFKTLHNPQGTPVYEDKIYCEYYPAGNTILRMDVPSTSIHEQRFHRQWAYFKSSQKEDANGAGTPLSQWAILSPADVENLKGMKIHTIENIAAMSDHALEVLGMGIAGMSPHVLRGRAQGYLGAAKDTALPQQQAAEIVEMRKQLEDMKALLQAKTEVKTVAKRKGRPPKVKEVKDGAESTATG